jgi:citrate lyase beta subunit
MPATDAMAAKNDLIKKQRDIIAQYLILDIEDFLAEAREKEEAEAEEAALIAKEEEQNKASSVFHTYA